jgi:hypothetical protein
VVDAEEELVAGLMPAGRPLVRREPQQLQVMIVGIAELDRLDAGRRNVRRRDRLWL